MEKAVLGSGKYSLQPQYSELGVDQSKWFSMSKEQRKRHLKKLNKIQVTEPDYGPGTSDSVVIDTATENLTDDPPDLQTIAASSSTGTMQYSTQLISQPFQATMLLTKLSSLSSKLGLPTTATDGIAKKSCRNF